ncbi:MAG: tetratricopeptide repeat protein, partial [Elusimicrobiota bacterium]
RVQRARALYAQVLPGARGWARALLGEGDALAALGHWDEANAAYGKLLDSFPGDSRVHGRRGEAYTKLGDWTSAAAERALQAERAPANLDNLAKWAEAARASGDLEQARLAAGKAEALDADDPRVKLQVAANALMERRIAEREGRGKANGRGVAKKPK